MTNNLGIVTFTAVFVANLDSHGLMGGIAFNYKYINGARHSAMVRALRVISMGPHILNGSTSSLYRYNHRYSS